MFFGCVSIQIYNSRIGTIDILEYFENLYGWLELILANGCFQEAQRDRVRPLRNTRYKDRPERAIYNPGAKAAERRQKQQTGGPEKTNDKVE